MRKVSLISMVLVVAVACASDTDPRGEAEDGSSGFSVTVVGTDGRRVTISGQPQRIVSLSATHTEMLYELEAGSQIAATDLTSDYPPEALETRKIDAFNFNVEEIAALEPDLVILAFDFQGEVEALDRLGIPFLMLEPARDLEGMFAQIRTIGDVTGHAGAAAALIVSLRGRLDSLLVDLPQLTEPLVAFHEVDATLYSPTSATFLGDIYSTLGLVNLADEVPDELGSGYVQVSEELILSADPDVIFLGDAEFGESVGTVGARPGWNTLTAIRNGWVYELDGELAGRWGPRTLDLMEEIVRAVREVAGS